ncbi:NAD(P)H-dependent 6'-deoxychalcone synthase-like protein [Cladobotryum mycophilum]|uniref:NAD(P)H-dependent 6'-deoxychalcone synthase-like protein n=1 Tax=Cladobotryum mycophilum TaxID=491253 RepID=A0ABR0SXW8_9HYPO
MSQTFPPPPKSRLARDLTFGPGGASTIPKLIYGTAWKKEETWRFVHKALRAGFRGLDTAGQSGHYDEQAVAVGLREACEGGFVNSEDIFVQSKINPPSLNPDDWPEGERALSWVDRVHQCIGPSIELRRIASRKYIDSYLLHTPMSTVEDTLKVWQVMSSYVPEYIGHLGISNVSLDFLTSFYEQAHPKPSFVQNRFYRDTRYEVELRKFCRERGVVFQSFWTLTANRHLLKSRPVVDVAEKMGMSKVVALYALVLGLGGYRYWTGRRARSI